MTRRLVFVSSSIVCNERPQCTEGCSPRLNEHRAGGSRAVRWKTLQALDSRAVITLVDDNFHHHRVGVEESADEA